MRWWEIPSRKISSITQTYDAGIMLGGTIRYYNSEVDRPVFGQGADRYMQSIELLSSKKVKQIILSSGSGSMLYKDAKEADFLRAQMLRIGIDSNLVIAESSSRNTYENAKNSAAIIKQKNMSGPFLLITSAFHMRRSLACFKKQGVSGLLNVKKGGKIKKRKPSSNSRTAKRGQVLPTVIKKGTTKGTKGTKE